jgi:hypothetical protein
MPNLAIFDGCVKVLVALPIPLELKLCRQLFFLEDIFFSKSISVIAYHYFTLFEMLNLGFSVGCGIVQGILKGEVSLYW